MWPSLHKASGHAGEDPPSHGQTLVTGWQLPGQPHASHSRDTKAAAASAPCLPLWALCCARVVGAGRPVASGQHPAPSSFHTGNRNPVRPAPYQHWGTPRHPITPLPRWALSGQDHSPHFTDGETEAQEAQALWSRTHAPPVLCDCSWAGRGDTLVTQRRQATPSSPRSTRQVGGNHFRGAHRAPRGPGW